MLATTQEGRLEETSYPFVFDLAALTRHVLITGTSGSGKTRVGQLITEGTSPDVAVVIIDPMGEFSNHALQPSLIQRTRKETGYWNPKERAS